MVYCCYLLTSANPRYERHTYIGFTVNPSRRLRQHNGELVNGALKTHTKRPWDMVVVCHGFPNKADALKFEWAWQNPTKSKRTKEMAKGLKGVGGQYFLRAKIRCLLEMLHLPPWRRFQLSLTWLTRQYTPLLAGCPALPKHMGEVFSSLDLFHLTTTESGHVSEGEEDDDPNEDPSVLMKDLNDENEDVCAEWGEREGKESGKESEKESGKESGRESVTVSGKECVLCHEDIHKYRPSKCVDSKCPMFAHVICLSSHFLRNETPYSSRVSAYSSPKLMPTVGTCPVCFRRMNWSDVIRNARALTEKDRKRKRDEEEE